MELSNIILIIGLVWPEPNSSAAGERILQLIKLFQEYEYDVVFASAAMDSDYMIDFESHGIRKQSIYLNDSSFDVFIKELNPPIVLFDRFMIEEQFGWRVAENCPNALRILDTEDLHCLRQARQLAFKEKRSFENSDLFSDYAKREVAAIYRCDITVMISEFEMELLKNVFNVPDSLIYYLSFLFEAIDERIIIQWPNFEQRNDFVFIGNFLHEPNWDAVKYLKQSIWPLIRKQLPTPNLRIYGAYPSQKVLQLHKPNEGFYIMGRAESAVDVVKNARLVLAPIRFGAGIKGKLVEAMICGIPSVTTTIGAEAMKGNLSWNGFITDDVFEFVDESVKLYNDKKLWQKAQQNGITIFNKRYLKSDNAPDFMNHINNIQSNITAHRFKNFTGAMLMHHMLAATKYMSKWIEEKNK